MLCGNGAMEDGMLGYSIGGAFFPFLRFDGSTMQKEIAVRVEIGRFTPDTRDSKTHCFFPFLTNLLEYGGSTHI